ncbi:protein-glutamine gamma-glutamyltransferase K-like [Apostichopus japonicus]|uniref:protein-glutamine gamma-glutamyltransferase K-like n=1 Tax=Stichopus japonicus TaxID=307972 RepID=UPI003AB21DB0
MMVRRSTRVSRTPKRFAYGSGYEPYPTTSSARAALKSEGRRMVPDVPLLIPKAPETEKQLKVISVDLLEERNGKDHHTDQYEVEQLVLRKGQAFHLDVEFDHPYDASTDTIWLEMLMGSRPRVSSGTRIVLPTKKGSPAHDASWVEVLRSSGNKTSLKAYLESDSIIGLFDLVVCTETSGEDEYRYDVETDVYVIFNPWCKHDGTYMSNDAERKEYVLNDEGAYFYGSKVQIGGAPWYQGQFEPVAIECVFHLLKKSGLTFSYWNSPPHIVRSLSALINSQDDDGVLVGNWSGDYSDGVEPTDWTGSISILKEYMETGKPVKYGQCWVFGSLFTTAMRAIGIPSRTITNFASAHDSDANLTLDYHFGEDRMSLPDEDEDSIWNFHVWNDAWMARPDLPEGYGGWQAVDATPQETSRGSFRMGPASLSAIKRGHVYLDYDTKFAFAEVNAETVYWTVFDNRRTPPEVITVDSDNVGKYISTKAVGRMARHDITDQYKFSEGTQRERMAVLTASKYVKSAKNFMKDVPKDVSFSVELPRDVIIGSDIEVTVRATNNSSSSRSVPISVSGSTVYYTGVKKATVVSSKYTLKISAGKTEDFKVTLTAEEYLGSLTEFAGFVFFIMGMVSETKQTYSTQRDFVLQKPELSIEVDDNLKVGSPFSISVSFENPLKYPLVDCRFRIEGPGIDGHRLESFRQVKPHERVAHRIRLTAKRSGTRSLNVTFASNEIKGVKSSISVSVAE